MYNSPELNESPVHTNIEGRQPLPERSKNAEVSTADATLRSMAEVTSERLKGSAISLDKKMTLTGATVETDKDGLVRLLKRPDGSQIFDIKYSNDTKKQLQSFVVSDADKNKIIYKRDNNGDTFSPFSENGQAFSKGGQPRKVELSANANLSYINEKGEQVIVRGNGAILPIGQGKFDVQFDPEGRIKKITPSQESISNGAKIREFAYQSKSEELTEVKVQCPAQYPGSTFTHRLNDQTKQWECRDQNGRLQSSPAGKRALSKDGVYIYQDAILVGNKPMPVSRVSYPNGIEELQNAYVQPDGSTIVRNYNAQGLFTGVQTFLPRRDQNNNVIKNKDGAPLDGMAGKKYMAGLVNGQAQIYESDPLTGAAIVWSRQPENNANKDQKWLAKVIAAGTDSALQQGQKLEARYNFEFDQDGKVHYKDERNALHTEFKDGSQKTVLSDGSIVLTDQQGYTIRAMKDNQNYLEYLWKDVASKQKTLSEVDLVVNNSKEKVWSRSGRVGVIQPDGRFSYEDDDGKLVFIDPDSTKTKYLVGKDKSGPTLTPAEILLENGARAKRIIEPGADKEHPKLITDTFVDDNGRNMQRTLELLDVITPRRAIAAHNQRIQEYKLTESIISTTNFNQPGSKPTITMQGTVIDLEIFKNGDLAVTVPIDAKNPFKSFESKRFEFRAKNMAASILPTIQGGDSNSPKFIQASKSMIPMDPETRLASAKERFEKVFTKDIVHRLPMRADGKPFSIDDYITEYLLLPQVKSVQNTPQTKEQLLTKQNEMAYKYELAYIIVDQQKLEVAASKR